jgi:GntR family transcriptional regulator/MocR family aminotransferase
MLYLDKDGGTPLFEQLYYQIKSEITEGRLQKNAPLKSLRILCKELNVSRNTIDRAYQQLIAEGYVRSSQGMGYFVEDIVSDVPDSVIREDYPLILEHHTKKPKVRYDFEYESVESSLFPWNKWKKYVSEAILSEEHGTAISYESNKGSAKLRESLCGFLFRHRGVVCKPEQMVLCAGTQYAMEILSTILPPGKNRFAFEEPGYAAMRYYIENKGYSVTSIPVLENGVYTLLLSRSNCNILYITPSHQFPTGAVTTIGVRNQLLKWAHTNEAYIIENDYDSEFRYGMMPIPSLQSLDKYNRVIYMNTLSKILSPSIRCAFLILPWELIEKFEQKYKYFNAALPAYHQSALANMINDGALERHLRKVSAANEKKYNTLVRALKEYMPDMVEIVRYPAGVHTLVNIKNCRKQKKLIELLEAESVRIYGIKEHCHDQINAYENIFMMGFNSMSETDIRDGCKKMANVLEMCLSSLGEK